MEKLDDLGNWRRSHYSIDVTPSLDGCTVTLFGLAASIRRQGGLIFIILQDREGIVQLTLHKDRVPEQVWERAENLQEHSFLGARGVVKSIAKAPHGAEMVPEALKVLAIPRRLPPIKLLRGRLPSLEKRLDLRSVDLRRPNVQAIFRVRHNVLQALRGFLTARGYLEVNTPKVIASATEGGAALFPLLYYNKEAFLAQSPQLYKEQLTPAFEKVFEVASIYRAEPFRTLRHLSETVSVDVEEAYVTYEDVMRLLEEMLRHIVEVVCENRKQDLETLGVALKPPELPLKRHTYRDVLKTLEDAGVTLAWGEDLSTQALKTLGTVEQGFYFITDWPTASKAFYIKPMDDTPETCEAFDLMAGSIELASGGSRVSSRRLLTKRLKEKGLNPKLFDYHLKVFDYGMPPHAGFGLGMDRLMMVLTGRENIREVVLFPRDQKRLTP